MGNVMFSIAFPVAPHCLMTYRNALRRGHGRAINSKLHHAPGCLSVIPDNTGVRIIACIAAQIRSTNKHAVRKCDRERNGSIGSVYCIYIYPLSICKQQSSLTKPHHLTTLADDT